MTNFKKIALGLMVGAMAISFSAFINAPKKSLSTTARYYNISGAIGSKNPANFVYEDNGTDLCIVNATHECSAEWSTTNAPVAGQSPTNAGSPSYVGSTTSGN